VERKKTAYPKRLRANIVTMISKFEGASRATTGALSSDGFCIVLSISQNGITFCKLTAGSRPLAI